MSFFRIAAALTLLPVTASAQQLSFTDARNQLGHGNEAILAARAEVTQREYELRASHRLMFPRVDATAKTVRIDEPITIDLSPIRSVILRLHPQVPSSAIPPFSLQVQDSTFHRAAVGFKQPVYTGGKITAAQRAAAAQLDEARELEEAATGATTTELARRYFGVVVAERVLSVRRDVVGALEEHRRHAIRLEEEGMISHAERLNADVALAEAKRALTRSEGDVRLAREALASVIAADETSSELTSSLFIAEKLPQSVIERDISGNPALRRAAAVRRQAAAATAAECASRKPSVAIAGSRELYENDLTILDPAWSVGVGVSYSVFDAGRGLRIAASRAREEKARLIEQKAQRDLAVLLDSQLIAIDNAREQYRTTETTLGLARENLRVRNRAFEEGYATSLEVVDARLALARVEIDRLSAAYDFDTALATLLETRGESALFDQLRSSSTEVK